MSGLSKEEALKREEIRAMFRSGLRQRPIAARRTTPLQPCKCSRSVWCDRHRDVLTPMRAAYFLHSDERWLAWRFLDRPGGWSQGGAA